MSNIDDYREVIELPDSGSEKTGKEKESSGSKEKSARDRPEKRCMVCGKTEKEAKILIELPGGLCVCDSCMNQSMKMMNMTFPGMNPEGQDQADAAEDLRPEDVIDVSSGEEDSEKKKKPKVNVINLGSIFGDGFPGFGGRQVKPRKAKEKKKDLIRTEPILNIRDIPAPHRIKEALDAYVVGQEQAKKVMSVAVYNHYKRIMSQDQDDGIEIEKSNMLMLGPTGSGKTYLVKTLARLLDVPLAITDATSLTEAGYIGDDIESVVSKLLANADNDVEKAERGIIFIDEIDKLAKKRNPGQRDVSGEAVQQGMLKLLEGAEVEVPVGASSKNAMVPMEIVDTTNILFICGGAFPDLEEVIKERLNKESSIGFQADLKDKYDKDENLLMQATVDDVRKFGMIPEFLGRLPVMFSLEALSDEMLVRILTEPKNAIVRQYKKLLAMDEVELVFEEDALYAIARKAKAKKVGARALRAVLEEYMLDIMYEIPKDDNIGRVIITESYIEKKGGPRIEMRGSLLPGPGENV